MVIKGRARGGPAALATHLERRDTNEQIHVRELQGVTARDVRGALREMDCMGSGATSVRTLYHAAINTAPYEILTDEQKQRAVERLEKELGFEGQPRIVIEHLKKDREHMHVVFLRIDVDRMVAIPDSHNFRKHEIVARDLEREFGHQRVQGAHIGREDGQERPPRTPGHDEMQQAERTKMTPQEATRRVTELWKHADSGRAFAGALAADGWILAKGDSRDYVLVDRAGETHSLGRRIEGVKAAEMRQRMADVDPASVPNIAEARALQRSQAEGGRTKEKAKTKTHQGAAAPPTTLKVKAPVAANDPARPLTVKQPDVREVARGKEAVSLSADRKVEASPKTVRPSEAKLKLRMAPEPGPLKKLYTVAAGATQRAYAKARGVFGKKETPAKLIEQQASPKPIAEPVRSEMASVRTDIKAKREAARQGDRQAAKGKIVEPKIAVAKSPDSQARDKAPDRARKPRLTREALDAMIGRQRQQREERSGPSR